MTRKLITSSDEELDRRFDEIKQYSKNGTLPDEFGADDIDSRLNADLCCLFKQNKQKVITYDEAMEFGMQYRKAYRKSKKDAEIRLQLAGIDLERFKKVGQIVAKLHKEYKTLRDHEIIILLFEIICAAVDPVSAEKLRWRYLPFVVTNNKLDDNQIEEFYNCNWKYEKDDEGVKKLIEECGK